MVNEYLPAFSGVKVNQTEFLVPVLLHHVFWLLQVDPGGTTSLASEVAPALEN